MVILLTSICVMKLRDLLKVAATTGVKSYSLPGFPFTSTPTLLSNRTSGPAVGLLAKSKAAKDLRNL